jgi:hypothetical protein
MSAGDTGGWMKLARYSAWGGRARELHPAAYQSDINPIRKTLK